jgi:nucleoside-diphosphate-sugar epimerase
MEKNKAKVLVTGASGFIGSHLCEELLRKGFEITGVDALTDYYSKEIKLRNMENAGKHEKFRFVNERIEKIGFIDDEVEFIFHLAAQPGVRASWGKSFDVYVRDNILATQHLLELCRGHKNLGKFIYSSSSSIYGDAEAFPTPEDSIPKPVSPYGVTKLAGEHLCELYHSNYEIPTVSLRYFTVFGPRQRPDMAFHKFIKAILEGSMIEVYGDGKQSRDFTFVQDVVQANLLAMKGSTVHSTFNIGGGNQATVNEVIEILQELIGKKANVVYQEKAKGDVKSTKADTRRARKELVFEPGFSLENGLKKEIDWIREIYGL